MASKKIESSLLTAVSNEERDKVLKDILLDFEKRIGRLEKFVIALMAIVVAVGGREYIISTLMNMASR